MLYLLHAGSSGAFVLTNLVSGKQYEITLSAIDIWGKYITVKRKVIPS